MIKKGFWALITQEQSQRPDLNRYTKMKRLVRTFGRITKLAFFWKEVITLTLADISSLTVRSTNTETYKIDGVTSKLFSRVQIKDKLKETYLFFEETFLVIE